MPGKEISDVPFRTEKEEYLGAYHLAKNSGNFG